MITECHICKSKSGVCPIREFSCIHKQQTVTVWRKILTGENIDEFDKFPTICQYFPIKILHLATYQ